MTTIRMYRASTASEACLEDLSVTELRTQVLARDRALRASETLLWVTLVLLWLTILLPGRPA